MTPSLNESTRRFLEAAGYEATSHVVDLVAIGVLVALLIEYELLRVAANHLELRLRGWVVAIAPLVVTFVAISAVRAAGIR